MAKNDVPTLEEIENDSNALLACVVEALQEAQTFLENWQITAGEVYAANPDTRQPVNSHVPHLAPWANGALAEITSRLAELKTLGYGRLLEAPTEES